MSKDNDFDLTWTCPDTGDSFKLIGPHEERELELMLAGKKPMAFFWVEKGFEEGFPKEAFEHHVETGRFVKISHPGDGQQLLEWLWYCLPDEAWRGKLARHIKSMFEGGALPDGFSIEDWEKLDGYLLGYPKPCVEFFIERSRRAD